MLFFGARRSSFLVYCQLGFGRVGRVPVILDGAVSQPMNSLRRLFQSIATLCGLLVAPNPIAADAVTPVRYPELPSEIPERFERFTKPMTTLAGK
jgi:hypothetical protein